MKICKYCNSEILNNRTKCPSCGAKEFFFRCDNCGSEIKNGNFCSSCGVKVGTKSKKCPKCQSEYYSNACPNCGYVQNNNSNNTIKDNTYENNSSQDIVPEKQRKKSGCLEVLITYIVAFISLVIYFKSGMGPFWLIIMAILIIYASSMTYKRNYCAKCNKSKPMRMKKCPHCGHKEASRVVSFGVAAFMIVVFVCLYFMIKITNNNVNTTESNQSSSSNQNNNTITTETANNVESKTKYKNSLEWAVYEENYLFAVEVDSFNGDIYSAGTYELYNLNTNLKEAGVYDIYIEEKELDSLDELGEIDYEVGGTNGAKEVVTLKQGDYVYIVPYKNLVYTPKDVLYMRVKK